MGNADFANGSSYSVSIPYRKGITYNFITSLDKEENGYNYWKGYVVDTRNNVKTKIGEWATPVSWQYLSGKSVGFIEIFTGLKSCNEIHPTSAYFGGAIGDIGYNQTVTGYLNEAYLVGVCKGKFNYSSSAPDSNSGRTFKIEQGVD